MRLTLGKKIAWGFACVLALMIPHPILTYVMVGAIQQAEERTIQIRVPTINACKDLQSHLNQSQTDGLQTILAGTSPNRRETARKLFDSDWDNIEKDVARLADLSPTWTLPTNRDRLTATRNELGGLRRVQETAMKRAAGGERDAVLKAGNDFADQAVPKREAIGTPLAEMVDSFAAQMQENGKLVDSKTELMSLAMDGTTMAAFGVGIFVAVFLSRRISGATQSVLAQAQAIAAGDLTREEMKIQSNDELGDLTKAINVMQSSLHRLIQSMTSTATQVAASSEQLSATSQKITVNSEETTAQAKVVAEAGGQVNINLQTLASGAEEMNVTIGEIAKNATEAAQVAGEAVRAAESANQTVSLLGDSSIEIEKVIEVITTIAQQTNLLALNATIEAARAGEAGKGFAVVANEVKELAKQTAKATEEIKQKIGVIRKNTGGAVTAIGGIREVIDKVSHISTMIASAVEEQSATTSEMARNVMEAARGSATISSNIAGVAQAAQSTSTSVGESQTATEHLARMANQLRQLVGQFKVDTGSAEQATEGDSEKAASHAAGAF